MQFLFMRKEKLSQYISPDQQPVANPEVQPPTPPQQQKKYRFRDLLQDVGQAGMAGVAGFSEGLMEGNQARTFNQWKMDKERKQRGLDPFRRTMRPNWLQRLIK